MGLLTFSINVTLDGCVDHREGVADEETHAFFTALMDEGGAMLWGRATYEMMESCWPAVARGDVAAPPAMREWAAKLEAKPKYVVSSQIVPRRFTELIRDTDPRKVKAVMEAMMTMVKLDVARLEKAYNEA
ncbi:MAG: dihydrofolate reductase family protein [Burkholderiales bacterium]|nr:dihydrofolate reductase family protein [Burkholderiales bacterium]